MAVFHVVSGTGMWLMVRETSASSPIARLPSVQVWSVEEGMLGGEEADGMG